MNNSRLRLNPSQRKALADVLTEKFSLRKAAGQLGVSVSSLKKWTAGQRTIPLDVSRKIEGGFPASASIFSSAETVPDFFWASKGGRAYVSGLSRRQLLARIAHARSFKKPYPIVTCHIEDEPALEFFGIMMGDGCITEYYSRSEKRRRSLLFVSGNAVSDKAYLQDYVRPLLDRAFRTHACIRFRNSSRTVDLIVRSKGLIEWLVEHGFPVGKKGQISIPQKIVRLPFGKLRHLVRGLFDTDGCLSARKSEGYRDPFVLISSSSAPLRRQLKSILRGQDFPAYDSSNMVGVKGAKHVRRWFREIGSSNKRNLSRYNRWLERGILPAA